MTGLDGQVDTRMLASAEALCSRGSSGPRRCSCEALDAAWTSSHAFETRLHAAEPSRPIPVIARAASQDQRERVSGLLPTFTIGPSERSCHVMFFDHHDDAVHHTIRIPRQDKTAKAVREPARTPAGTIDDAREPIRLDSNTTRTSGEVTGSTPSSRRSAKWIRLIKRAR